MRWEGIRNIPVEDEGGRLVGLFTIVDVVEAQRRRGTDVKPLRIGEIMHREPRTVTADTPTLEAIRLMREENLSALCVVNEEGSLEGILTGSDFLVVVARLLE